MASPFIFSPKDFYDEMRIYRPTPIAWTKTTAVLLNNFGATLFTSQGDTFPLALPDGDEVLVGADGVIYVCDFNDAELLVKTYRYEKGMFRLDQEFRTSVIQGLNPDKLVILNVPKGLELWFDSSGQYLKLWSIIEGIACTNSCIVFSSGQVLGFKEDLGVRGMYLNIVDLSTRRTWRISSDFVFSALDRVFAVSTFDPASDKFCNGLYVFKDGVQSFLKLDGPVLEAGGNTNFATITVFDGNDAKMHSITENDTCTLQVQDLVAPTGYKTLSLDGSTYTVRGFSDTLMIKSADPKKQLAHKIDLVAQSHNHYPNQSKYLVSRAVTKTIGTVIHFHGGPESQEVPEGRFYGLPQWCNKHGIDWIGVNYQGSLMPKVKDTRSAWHRWKSALSEDLLAALDLAYGPVVLMGWSFGATIALALGTTTKQIKGLLLGAVTGDFVKHVEYAISLNSEHRNWFLRRFDLKGDDGLFFNGLHGFRPDLKVLEFHGKNDVNCPVFLANDVARQWEENNNPWQRVWLPGGEHYASTPEDAEIIFKNTRQFLTQVLIDQYTYKTLT